MSKKATKMKQGEGLAKDRTDWQRLDKMTDADIDYSDIAHSPATMQGNENEMDCGLHLSGQWPSTSVTVEPFRDEKAPLVSGALV